MENQGRRSFGDRDNSNEIFSKSIKAGKRTYFFDVKLTRSGDHLLVVTESRKVMDDRGNFVFQKNRMHVHAEDFDKFLEGFNEAVNFSKTTKPFDPERYTKSREERNERSNESIAEPSSESIESPNEASKPSSFTDVNFEDLGSDHS
jgi:hypothetical protein